MLQCLHLEDTKLILQCVDLANCALKLSHVRTPFLCNTKSSCCCYGPAMQGQASALCPSGCFSLQLQPLSWCQVFAWFMGLHHGVQWGESGRAAHLHFLSMAQKWRCDVASSNGPEAGAAVYLARRGSTEDHGELPTQRYHLWVNNCLHGKAGAVISTSVAFRGKESEGLDDVGLCCCPECQGSVQSLVGVPALLLQWCMLAGIALHWLAPSLLSSCPSVLGLFVCSEVNPHKKCQRRCWEFAWVHHLNNVGAEVTYSTQGTFSSQM